MRLAGEEHRRGGCPHERDGCSLRMVIPRLGHAQAASTIAHRLCRRIWKILHQIIWYEERGPGAMKHRVQRRAAKMIREIRSLDYRVELVCPVGQSGMIARDLRPWTAGLRGRSSGEARRAQ
jgi:hypothetical protein